MILQSATHSVGGTALGQLSSIKPETAPTVRSDLTVLMETALRLVSAANEIKGRVVGYSKDADGGCGSPLPTVPSAREGVAIVAGRLGEVERELNAVLEAL